MKAPAFALFARTLRQEARSWNTYATRLCQAGSILAGLIYIQLDNSTSAPGLDLFSWVMFINLLLISAIGRKSIDG